MPLRSRLSRPSRAAATIGRGPSGIDVESRRSWPPMISCSSAESRTVRETGPIWSSDDAIAIAPKRETPP